jgi:hypothetical protein
MGLMETSIPSFPDQATAILFFRHSRKAPLGMARERSAFVDPEAGKLPPSIFTTVAPSRIPEAVGLSTQATVSGPQK